MKGLLPALVAMVLAVLFLFITVPVTIGETLPDEIVADVAQSDTAQAIDTTAVTSGTELERTLLIVASDPTDEINPKGTTTALAKSYHVGKIHGFD